MTHVVHLGTNGFPKGMAAIERIRLLSLALIESGCSVRVISRKGLLSPSQSSMFPPHGQVQGIDYNFVNDSIVRPEGFVKRNLSKLIGHWKEWRFLRSLKRKKQIDAVILSSMDLGNLLYYRLVCSLLSLPLIYQLVELNTAMQNRQKLSFQIADRLLEKYALGLPDAILPISKLLTEFCQKDFNKVPILPIPVICDYQAFEQIQPIEQDPYFLYCGSSSYAEVVFFLIDAFESIPLVERLGHKLLLIIGGDDAGKKKIQAYIRDKALEEEVMMFSGLSYEDLVRHYKGAEALLIPLRPRKQDQARFPHKIGEYLASGKAVITTNIGEIPNYFTDEQTALVAEQYDTQLYAEKMRFVLNNPNQTRAIGINGRKLGLKYFDCYQYGDQLKENIIRLVD